MQNNVKTIIVSGGWGYGNLGDDALLAATSTLLKSTFPDAKIIWTSYDIDFTKSSGIDLDGELVPSVHRLLRGEEAFRELSTAGKVFNIFQFPYYLRRTIEKYIYPISRLFLRKPNKEDNRLDQGRMQEYFAQSAIFLMSGGGYFNQWEGMFQARVRELKLAHEAGCKVVLFGQSIGSFTSAQKRELQATFRAGDRIFVRDPDSVAELKEMGFLAELIPDIAMMEFRQLTMRPRAVCLIPAELTPGQIKSLVKELSELDNIIVNVILTRLIYPDIVTAKRVYKQLRRHAKFPVYLHIPRNYKEMLSCIEGSEWILSRGLHGMILGWRSGSNVFALTTSRKVDGFLRAIGCPANQLAEAEWAGRLGQLLKECLRKPVPFDEEKRQDISCKIQEGFERAMDSK